MPDADETSELRALYARAYGRDGGLTAADAVRLQALENARVETQAVRNAGDGEPGRPDGLEPDGLVPESPASDGRRAAGDGSLGVGSGLGGGPSGRAAHAVEGDTDIGAVHGASAVTTADTPAAGAGSLRSALRSQWKVVAAASAALLIVGLGAGWALFGPRADGVALTASQQERRVELQTEGGYDEGSVRAIGTDEDAIVWYGTKKEGELECIVLDAGDESSDMCQQADELVSQGYGVGVTVRAPDGDGGSDEDEMEISATAVRSASGEIVAIIQRWPSSRSGWLAQFPAEERERAEELLALGFEEYSFSVVGYVDDLPVWRGTKVDDGIAQECMIVDALEVTRCADAWSVQSGDAAISIGGDAVDDAGRPSGSWSIDLQVTTSGNAYLTIRGDVPAAPGPATGTLLEVGGENGDPISVEAPSDPAG